MIDAYISHIARKLKVAVSRWRHSLHARAYRCPVCSASAGFLDTVDFSRSCEEACGKFLPLSGIPIHYYLCDHCGFCFAPQFQTWSFDEFRRHIYNDQYIIVDPDYAYERLRANAGWLANNFLAAGIRHLDYGGGNGILCEEMRQKGWNSLSYDPFVNIEQPIGELGKFDLITAFEVFEHVPEPNKIWSELTALRKPDGILLFSTFLSNGHIQREKPLTWWYASPRNRHVCLFSAESLATHLHRHGLRLASFSPNLHLGYTTLPAWASHLAADMEKA